MTGLALALWAADAGMPDAVAGERHFHRLTRLRSLSSSRLPFSVMARSVTDNSNLQFKPSMRDVAMLPPPLLLQPVPHSGGLAAAYGDARLTPLIRSLRRAQPMRKSTH
jgi:hypothetical protein